LQKIITRFAPSPTGFLHIGGARTALFNWLFAKHNGGKFLLRIEDTDRKRSNDEAISAIFRGMKWLGLDWDNDAYSQFERRDRHIEVAEQLIHSNKAYHCFCTPEQLNTMRDKAKAAGLSRFYDGTWRDRKQSDAPKDIKPVIRLRAPLSGQTKINDAIQGEVTVNNETLDDMILVRSDGTPTYLLAVVVDDHDMEISHVIRGDDHLTNTFRQIQIYEALGWTLPIFAHMPLLHGADGAKLSKRHGALGVEVYQEMGFLPEAVNNYLLRLGWSHGDDEIISKEQAINWFDLNRIGKSAARFDIDKLNNLNSYYIKKCDNDRLINLIRPEISEQLAGNMSEESEIRLKNGMPNLKNRVTNIKELANNSLVYCIRRKIEIDQKTAESLDQNSREILLNVRHELTKLETWTEEILTQTIHRISDKTGVGLGRVAQPLRSALCGSLPAPGIFEVMKILGKEETLGRLDDIL
jgi:glutamyl-tRNA synthetase